MNFSKMTYEQQQAIGREFLDRFGLHDWRFSMENLRNTRYLQREPSGFLGVCDHTNKVIRIDWRIGRMFRQTMLHEIAHALVGKDGDHGSEWLDKAHEIGCSQRHLLPYGQKILEKLLQETEAGRA
jgi:hypothetical protein